MPLQVVVSSQPNLQLLELEGSLDEEASEELLVILTETLRSNVDVHIDIRALSFLSPRAAAVVADAYNHLEARGRHLRVIA